MKKFIYLLFILFLLTSFKKENKNQDNKITHVVYKILKPTDNTSNLNAVEKESLKSFNSTLEQVFAFEFDLYFNKNESIFKVSDKLQVDSNENLELAKIISDANIVWYKNLSNLEKKYQIESIGETFNVSVNFNQYNWTISNESKFINGYKCYKATTHYEEFDKFRKKTIVFNPIVWFTPEIPSSFGPSGLDGLPGLVLEGTLNGNKIFYATKIIFETDIKIEKLKKGKEVTEQEYLKILYGKFSKD